MSTAVAPQFDLAWKDLRLLAKAHGVPAKQTRELIEKQLIEKGVTPQNVDVAPASPVQVKEPKQPAPAPVTVAGRKAAPSRVHPVTHTRDATKIVDDQGNMLAMVYRLGRMVGNERVVLDMDGNANKIVAAFKE